MSVSSQTALEKGFVLTDTGAVRAGIERVYALNKLKASPRNARKAGHPPAVVEQRAASILAKGLLQMPVVEPELRADGSETGYGLVTIGEGRRLALRLLAKRKLIPRTVAVRCLVDTVNDPAEISLDENISRAALHPADEFEAFKDLADRLGWGAEAIGARFGVTAAVVRQRLRLGAVVPALVAAYRAETLTLDQLMAFAVSEDHERQLQVFEAHGRAQAYVIRRAMTEATVPAHERRVIFLGLDAYLAAGGVVIRDLFTEDGGGYLSDPALLDRLVGEKLAAMAQELRDAEGWKWGEAHLDYPHGHGLARVWPRPMEISQERAAESQALRDEYESLSETWGGVEDLPSEVEARLSDIEARLAEDRFETYDPDEQARAGVWVVLGYDGEVRIERGLVRPEDVSAPPEQDDEAADEPQVGGALDDEAPATPNADEPEGDAAAPLSARLIAELTAHRTAGLRLALSNAPDLALVALTHVLVLATFFRGDRTSCLDIRLGSAFLPEHGEGVKSNPAYEALETRFGQWAKTMPQAAEGAWDFVVGLDGDSRASLLAFCVATSLNAVRGFEGRRTALAQADVLATATELDMAAFWTPTADRYLARVTKAHVLAAVAEAVSPDAAQRLSGAKKADLVAAAEPDLIKARWLPTLLRTAVLSPDDGEIGDQVEPGDAAPEVEASKAAPDEAEATVMVAE